MNLAEAVYQHFYWRRKRQAESARAVFSQTHVISVGNITTGGTGKTPAVQWLARRLQNAGVKTVIIARGYGGAHSAQGAIVSDGKKILLNARQAGDEAVLHARALPSTPVLIGRDRIKATRIALEKFAPQIILLDDGFQYWSLARDFDLVLLDARRPFENGKLLPVGRLREPKSELGRADGVLLTRSDRASDSELKRTLDEVRILTDAPIFQSSHAPIYLRNEAGGEQIELQKLHQQPIAVLSALANNENFHQSLKACGANVICALAKSDHHSWQQKEVRSFAREAKAKGAQFLVTTEKDAVKLDSHWSDLPLWSLVIELQIENEDELWKLISKRIL